MLGKNFPATLQKDPELFDGHGVGVVIKFKFNFVTIHENFRATLSFFTQSKDFWFLFGHFGPPFFCF